MKEKYTIVVDKRSSAIFVNGQEVTTNQFTQWAVQISNEIYNQQDPNWFERVMEERRNERRNNPKQKDTFLYLMRDTRTGLYKIGRAKNPAYREKTLQSDNPLIEIIKQWPGTITDESDLHDRFKKKRVRGEWFNLNESDLDVILNLL